MEAIDFIFYLGLSAIIIILTFYYLKALGKNKESFREAAAAKEANIEKENMLKQISLQKDEIEALYEETYAINGELTSYIKKLNESQKELQEINQEISAMYAISRNINSSLNIDILFHDIYELLKSLLDYDMLAILLLDSENKYLQIKYWNGPNIEGLMDLKLYLDGKSACALCAREKRAFLIEDIDNFEDVIKIHEDMKQEMAAPLLYNDELIGVFILDTFKSGTFDNHKLTTLCSFASLASTALYNAKVYSDLKKTYESTAKALAKAIEAKDVYTKGHCDRVTDLSLKTAKYLKLNNEEQNKIKIAAILHDIGKIGIPEGILNKPGALTTEEYSIVKKHPSIGYEILSDIEYLGNVRKIIYQHHERYDGKGYPLGLDGNQLLTEAKILSLADAFDAMTSTRPYRKPMSMAEAIEEIKRNQGTQFDPNITTTFIEMIENEY